MRKFVCFTLLFLFVAFSYASSEVFTGKVEVHRRIFRPYFGREQGNEPKEWHEQEEQHERKWGVPTRIPQLFLLLKSNEKSSSDAGTSEDYSDGFKIVSFVPLKADGPAECSDLGGVFGGFVNLVGRGESEHSERPRQCVFTPQAKRTVRVTTNAVGDTIGYALRDFVLWVNMHVIGTGAPVNLAPFLPFAEPKQESGSLSVYACWLDDGGNLIACRSNGEWEAQWKPVVSFDDDDSTGVTGAFLVPFPLGELAGREGSVVHLFFGVKRGESWVYAVTYPVKVAKSSSSEEDCSGFWVTTAGNRLLCKVGDNFVENNEVHYCPDGIRACGIDAWSEYYFSSEVAPSSEEVATAFAYCQNYGICRGDGWCVSVSQRVCSPVLVPEWDWLDFLLEARTIDDIFGGLGG